MQHYVKTFFIYNITTNKRLKYFLIYIEKFLENITAKINEILYFNKLQMIKVKKIQNESTWTRMKPRKLICWTNISLNAFII